MNFDAFVGSVWFGVMMALSGYVVGNLFPIAKLKNLIKRG